MLNRNYSHRMKKGAVLLALALAAMIPFAALAESPTVGDVEATAGVTVRAQMPGRGGRGFNMGGPGFVMGGYCVDTSTLTDEQKAVYDSALALYEQVEDAVLSDLVAANVIAKEDADAYIAQRAVEKSLGSLDQTQWTAEQYKAFYEANAKTGDERKTAMQALADNGQLTQEQAAALSAQGQDGLWAKIAKNANTNSAIQTAMVTLRQARQHLNNTLQDAGITTMGRGIVFGGFGNGGMGFGDNRGGFGPSNRPQNGKDGRR